MVKLLLAIAIGRMGVFKDLHVYLVEESIDDITKVVS